jgi:hypothetical protein
MIVDFEDLLMLFVALAPFPLLVLWLMRPRSKVRILILVASLTVFVFFLPYVTLYLGVLFMKFFPRVATSSAIGNAAPLIFASASVLCAVLIGILVYRAMRMKV